MKFHVTLWHTCFFGYVRGSWIHPGYSGRSLIQMAIKGWFYDSTFPGNKPLVVTQFTSRGWWALLELLWPCSQAMEESPHLGISTLSLKAREKHVHEQRPRQAPAPWDASMCSLIVDYLLVTQKPQDYYPVGTYFSTYWGGGRGERTKKKTKLKGSQEIIYQPSSRVKPSTCI